MKKPILRSVQLRNFKAIQNSKTIRLSPLTVFIGNNGSGKSSVIEGLMTYQMIVDQDLESAMNYWRGFRYIRNQAVKHPLEQTNTDRNYEKNPIEFKVSYQTHTLTIAITASPDGQVFIYEEILEISKQAKFRRDLVGKIYFQDLKPPEQIEPNVKSQSSEEYIGSCPDDLSMLTTNIVQERLRQLNRIDVYYQILEWQFLNLNPTVIGDPISPRLTSKQVKLAPDASNLSQYLLDIYKQDQDVFDGIVETLQYVIPYASDLQAQTTSQAELESRVYLKLTEQKFYIPGWLLSTGTLRITALLSLLRHPQPPPLIMIEEIENGLDPRSINLIVDEIREVIESGKTQVMLTTHSPYLLDLLNLSHIILVERDETGQPVLSRPIDQQSLSTWSEQFAPGQLYTMGQLNTKR